MEQVGVRVRWESAQAGHQTLEYWLLVARRRLLEAPVRLWFHWDQSL